MSRDKETKTACLPPTDHDLRFPGPAYDPNRHLPRWQDQYRTGSLLRKHVKRKQHAGWKYARERPDLISLIRFSNRGRQKDLLPLRMKLMAKSPYAFMRGTAGIMAADLSGTPANGTQLLICGDAHLNNFGLYGTRQRNVVFDLDDFDEVTVGPWEWDLKRLVASVNVAGRANGLDRDSRSAAVRHSVEGYRENARYLRQLPILDLWYLHHYPGEDTPVFKPDKNTRRTFQKAEEKARKRNNKTQFSEHAVQTSQGWQFAENPKDIRRLPDETVEAVKNALTPYTETLSPELRSMFQRYRVADIAHRVVGTSSVGLRTYVVMLLGNGDKDPLFLQVKEAIPSAVEPYIPSPQFHNFHRGEWIVHGQRIMQAATDILLGWTSIHGQPFYVRQIKNMKGSINLKKLKGSSFGMYAGACGTLLARVHARSGDIAKIAGYCGKSDALDEALASFAESYGDQIVRDHKLFRKALKAGHLPG